MNVKIISKRLEPRGVTVRLVDGSLVKGKINMHSDEMVIQRVSDIFTKIPDPFIVMFDATAEGTTGRVLILNKNNISWVAPED